MLLAGNQFLSVCKGSMPCFQDVNAVKDAQHTQMLSSCAPCCLTSTWHVYPPGSWMMATCKASSEMLVKALAQCMLLTARSLLSASGCFTSISPGQQTAEVWFLQGMLALYCRGSQPSRSVGKRSLALLLFPLPHHMNLAWVYYWRLERFPRRSVSSPLHRLLR